MQNFLQLNKEKTEVIAFGNKDEVLKVNAYLDSRGQTTKNLGVILETDLSFSSHVKAVTKSVLPPGSTPSQLVLAPSGSRTRDASAGGGRSTKEAKGYSP